MAKQVDDKENIYAEESYRSIATILNSLDALVYVADMQTYELLFVNEYGRSIWGDIKGKTCWKALQTNQDGPCSFCTNNYLLDEFGVPAGVHVWEFQNTVNQRWYHCRDQAIRWIDGRCVRLEIASDITDRKQAEEDAQRYLRDMAHVMRLSTMGEMASGLAHELNQPLTALTSYCGTAAKLVKDLPSPPQQLGEILERAEEQAHRASQIISHLRAFLRKADGHKEPLDLDRVIVGMIDFIKPELKNGHAKIAYLPGAGGSKVMADKVQIEQVLINLVLNSLEAINGSGGKAGNIIVQTRLLPNETIETTVADDGPGIDAGIADRMFDPFQTSKSSGMGMGLSISRSIIEENEGKLWADVRRENGALFGFNLPVSK
jgi:C4-dicarboxylate-specific signal transduction histidine kinase